MQKKYNPIKIIISFLLLILMIALIYKYSQRRYYLISIVLIFLSFIPFLARFEKGSNNSNKVVLIAVFTAIAVAGRALFFMLPQFKPTVAIIIIAGICLNAESGAIIGMLTGFVSNFFYSQGPWTPWQMLALCIIGLISGIVFNNKNTVNKYIVALFGLFCAMFIYGGIMNFSSLLLYTPSFNIKQLIAVFSTALSFDLIHAGATAIFLFFSASPIVKKINRIKLKYGAVL